MSHSDIRKAFNDKVREYGATKGYHVVLQNAPYKPTVKETYLKTYIIPSSAVSQTLGGDHKRYMGVFQVDILIPNNIGTGDITRIVNELQEVFPVYNRISFGADKEVIVLSPVDMTEGKNTDTHFSTPCWFTYRSDSN
jgi:hypothetical protein